jgi:hypothetical protein
MVYWKTYGNDLVMISEGGPKREVVYLRLEVGPYLYVEHVKE